MKRNRVFAVVGIFCVMSVCYAWAGTAASADASQSNSGAAFDKLKTLAGQWEASTQKGNVTSSWELVSNGTALLEKIKVPGESEMVTVYYLEGNRLVLTHYCTAGNQPHMRAAAFEPGSNVIRFDFLSATNLASAADGHMHSAQVKFLGADAFEADWTFYKDGKPAFTEPIQFHRVR